MSGLPCVNKVRDFLTEFWKTEVDESLLRVLQEKQIPLRARLAGTGHCPEVVQPGVLNG